MKSSDMEIGGWKPTRVKKKVVRRNDDGGVGISFVELDVEGATISVGGRTLCTLLTPVGRMSVLNLEGITLIDPEGQEGLLRDLSTDLGSLSADAKKREVLVVVERTLRKVHGAAIAARSSEIPLLASAAEAVCLLVDNMDEIVRVLTPNSNSLEVA